MKVRHEIIIISDETVEGTGDSQGRAQLTTTDYDGTVTYYFEVVGSWSGSNSTVTLRRVGTTTDDATVTLTGSNQRVRSASFTPPAGTTGYMVRVVTSGAQAVTARIIIIQDSSSFTKTACSYEVGLSTSVSGTTAVGVKNIWRYDSANYDGSPAFVALCVGWITNSMETATFLLQEDDGSFNVWTDKITVGTTTSTTPVFIGPTSFTPVDGRHYRIAAKSSGTMYGIGIRSSKVIMTAASSPTKFEEQYLLHTIGDASVGLINRDSYYDPAEWSSVTTNYYHEVSGITSGTADAKLQSDPNGTPTDITNSTLTNIIERERTSALTMPGSAKEIDTNLTESGGGGSFNAGRIIVVVTPSGTTTQKSLPATAGSTATIVSLKLKLQSLAATAGSTSTFVRKTSKSLSATEVSLAIISRITSKILSATETAIGTMLKTISKTLSATETSIPSMTRIPTFVRQLAATVVSVATLSTQWFAGVIQQSMSAIAGSTAEMFRTTKKVISATEVSVASMLKQVSITLLAISGSAATVLKQTSKTLVASAGSLATILAQTVKALAMSAVAGSSASMARMTLKILSATEVGSATISKLVSKSFSVISVSIPAILKKTSKSLSATAGSTSAMVATWISGAFKQALSATATGVATISRKTSKAMSVSLISIATIVRKTYKTLATTVVSVPGLFRKRFKALSATAGSVAAIARKTSISMVVSAVSVTAMIASYFPKLGDWLRLVFGRFATLLLSYEDGATLTLSASREETLILVGRKTK